MAQLILCNLTADDLPDIAELQRAYQQAYPGVPVIPGEIYLSPAFHDGEDVFCAYLSDSGEDRLIAYAPVYAHILDAGPADLPHRVWTEIKAHPDLVNSDEVKDQLLEIVEQRARELTAAYPGRAVVLTFEYRLNEIPAIEYVQARGFQYEKSVFVMRRALEHPAPEMPTPEGISIRRWKMNSLAEQQEYVTARNECFPEAPVTLAEWQYYLQSPQWAAGTMIGAFAESAAGSELVGAVNVFWNAVENERTGRNMGFTEDIFVRPAWRGKGVAPAAVAEGLRYLGEHGLEEAYLAVSALNRNALGLYLGLGYQVIDESRHYQKSLI